MRSNLSVAMSYSTLPSMQKKKQGNLIETVGGGGGAWPYKNTSIKKPFLNKRRARGLKGQSPFLF